MTRETAAVLVTVAEVQLIKLYTNGAKIVNLLQVTCRILCIII